MPQSHTHSGWLPLMDYAVRTGVSLSTLRRHIKANKIQYRVENGKYFVWHMDYPAPQNEETEHLRRELQRAHEEIAELKTLIALYEEKIPGARSSN